MTQFRKPDGRMVAGLAAVAAALGGYALLAGVLSFLGWALDIPSLTAWGGARISVQPNAAVAATASGLALIALAHGRHLLAAVVGTVPATIGLVTLLEHLLGVNLGIDALLLFDRPWGGYATVAPGRIGLPGAVAWTFIGIAIVLAARGGGRGRRIAAAFALAASALGFLSIVGYLFGADPLYSLPRLTAIALQTATMVLALGLGLLAALPDRQPMRTLLEGGAAGMLARRALPLVILIPVVVGWLRTTGQEEGLYDAAFGAAMRTLVEVGLMTLLLWWCVRVVRAREQSLRTSEEFNRRIIESSRDCVKVLDLDGRILSMNSRGQQLFGVTDIEACLNRMWVEFWSGSDREAANRAVLAAIGGDTSEFVGFLPTFSGEDKWWQVAVSPMTGADGKTERLLVVSRDVTAQKATADALRESERRFHEMIDALPVAIYTTDAEGWVTYFNPAAVEFAGRTPRIGEDRWCISGKLLNGDGSLIPHDECSMSASLRSGKPVRGAEAIAERPDGSRIWFEPYPTPLFDTGGRVVGGINMLVNITDRKRDEVAAARLAAIVECSDDAIVSKSLDGIVISWNQGAERIFGYSAAEAVGRHISFIIPAERLSEEDEVLSRLRRGEKIDHFETERKTRDNRRVFVSLTVSPIRDHSGTIVGASKIARDITERKRTEAELRLHRERLQDLLNERTAELEASHQRLRLAERMASLGTLSAGLGHDMGNLLIPIRLRLESLENESLSSSAREDVTAIRTSADYLQKLASGLRMLALDPSRGPGEPTEVTSWWLQAEGVCRSVLPRGVRLAAEISSDCGTVAISRPALTQAVFNLIQNAGDAVRERGHGMVTIRAVRSQNEVRISVTDDGPGMSPEVKARCLEPFFTTKPRGISTGLGLALVRGLVHDAGGRLEMESELGRGTVATLIVPAVASPAFTAPQEPMRCAVVDIADARIRSFVATELQSLRYHISTESPQATDADLFVLDNVVKLEPIPADSPVILFDTYERNGRTNVRSLGARPQFRLIREALREIGGRGGSGGGGGMVTAASRETDGGLVSDKT